MALKFPALHVIERIKWMSSWMYSAKANTASYSVSFQKLPEARCSAVLFLLSPLWRVFLDIFPPQLSHPWCFNYRYTVYLFMYFMNFWAPYIKRVWFLSPTPLSRNQFFPLRGTTTSIENAWFRRYSKKNWKNFGLAKKFVWIFL